MSEPQVVTLLAMLGAASVAWCLPTIVEAVMHAPVMPTVGERLLGILVAAGSAAILVTSDPRHAPALVPLVMAAVPLAWIDAVEHRLPHVLVLPLYPAILSVVADRAGAVALALGAMVAMGVLVVGAGMGGGDATLSGALALSLSHIGLAGLTTLALMAFTLAGVAAAAGVLTRRIHRHQTIAFGPALLVAAGVVAVVSV